MSRLTILVFFLMPLFSQAEEISIFSVNKTLSMGPKDPVYRDYYLNGGTQEGFRRGMLVTVVRRVPVHDLSRNRALGDLRVPVAKLKLIYVNRSISVGRVEKLIEPTNYPAAEFKAVMVGDTVTLGDGMDDLGRMDDMEGDGAKGTAPNSGQTGGTSADNETAKSEVKAEVAALTEAPAEAPKPAPVEVVPEKNAEKPDTKTKEPLPKANKKTSAKAPTEGKKPLKAPVKPDNSPDHAVVGPST